MSVYYVAWTGPVSERARRVEENKSLQVESGGIYDVIFAVDADNVQWRHSDVCVAGGLLEDVQRPLGVHLIQSRMFDPD